MVLSVVCILYSHEEVNLSEVVDPHKEANSLLYTQEGE